MILFSIITVCLNAENTIDSTIRSVLGQDYDNFEYLIQDGASTDHTLEIAESYADDFSNKGIPFRILSQKDKGIYDAMNIAAQQAHGEWILYMNSGDCFANRNVLSKVSGNKELKNTDIVYGDVIFRNDSLYLYKKPHALDTIRFGMPFCHQSVFTRKMLLETTPFSLQYKICSDFLLYFQLYLEGKKFAYFPMAISIFDTNGISSDYSALYKEQLRIYEMMPVKDAEAIELISNRLKKIKKDIFIYEHFWKFIPKKLRQIRRDYTKKKAGWKTEEDFYSQFGK